MLHSSSMSFIFLDSSSFCISSFWITSDSDNDTSISCLEMSLRILFSRLSRRLLRSLNRAVTLSASPDAFFWDFLHCSSRFWILFLVFFLFFISFWRTFLSFFFFFSEASSSASTRCPRCSPARLQDTQIQAASSVQ
ncbi:hypothetical protein GDO81_027652 [Engystomops pustulosus]|uniref:Transmembrane protein n=1 Tax=Engystomops pustulosus TaxID=76066 RepID=A0AAV6ZRU2_ENGPU|nr:hypothetical protein GDO81_027652 [Engystomops pustulosus]